MIRRLPDPARRAAMTKSSSRKASSLPRTTRARPVQPTRESTTTMPKYSRSGGQSRGSAAARPIHSGSVGIEIKRSMIRWMIVSISPPRYPDKPPSSKPRTKVMATPTNPIDSEIREPYTARVNRSRPR